MKSQPDPPAPPNPAAIAGAQGAANREAAEATARLAMTEEVSPFGTSTYEATGEEFEVAGGDPIAQYRRTVALNPEDQAQLGLQRNIARELLETGQGQLGRVSESFADPFTLDGLPPAASMNETARQGIEDSLYARSTARLDPQFQKRRSQLENQLVNQGFVRGSTGYNKAMQELGFQETDAYEQARRAASAGAISEQGRLFGLDAATRERALTEKLLERGMPLQELQALTGSAPGINVPQFAPIPTASVNPADVVGANNAAYAASQNAYNQQMASNRATAGGLFGLGAAGIQGALARM